MESGNVSLESLYDHVASDPVGASIYGNSACGKELGRKISKLTKSIPQRRGFYLWGRYEKNKLWRTTYLGKAGYGKTTSLQARITEEFKDERVFLWHGPSSKLEENELMKLGQKYYPTMWHRYESHFRRAIKKGGTTHVIWISSPGITNDEVTIIEADLIETMNPIVNIQRPGPVSDLQNQTVEIIRMFKYQIHKCRYETFVL